MTDREKYETDALETLLQEASDAPTDVPQHLYERVLHDAALEQVRFASKDRVKTNRQRLLDVLRDTLGGWPVLAGLAAASCAGFWIGVSPPQFIPDAGSILLGHTSYTAFGDVDAVAGFGWVWEEG